MLYRYAALTGVHTNGFASRINSFADSSEIHDWAKDAMAWCVTYGILTGKTEDTLAPTATATREEVAVMLQRFVELMK